MNTELMSGSGSDLIMMDGLSVVQCAEMAWMRMRTEVCCIYAPAL